MTTEAQTSTFKKTEFYTCLVCNTQYQTMQEAMVCAETPLDVKPGDLFIVEREYKEPVRRVKAIEGYLESDKPSGLCKVRLVVEQIGPRATGTVEYKTFTRDARSDRGYTTGYPGWLPASESLIKARIKDVRTSLDSCEKTVQGYKAEIQGWTDVLDVVKGK